MSQSITTTLVFGVAAALASFSSATTDHLPPPYAQELTCGRLFYRTLYLDEVRDTLFIGGVDKLISANLANISRADCERNALNFEATNADQCISKGKSEDFDCRNHIRVIQPIGQGDRLYVCGTNAHSPKDEVIYSNLTRLDRKEYYPGVGDGIAKCPFDPEDNSTALWVEYGNPGGHPAIYSGTNAEFTKADTVIFRGDIFDVSTGRREYTFKRTIKYDSHMLDKPDFVGSYDIGEHVYFFFRETAVEYLNCGKTIYSRIARVCKRDVGGKNILNQNWATYLKSRLNCSISGDFPFFFNEIQHVYKIPDDDSTFHAVFSTSSNGLMGSAICSFKLSDVETTFNGKFKEQATSTSLWLPVPSADVPEPRPGTCVKDTRSLPDSVLNFIRKHPLMDADVPHDSSEPVFYRRDVMFTRIVVDKVRTGRYGQEREYTIYYAGTADGKVYKISRWQDGQGKHHSRLLDVFPVTSPHSVRAMAISSRRKSLYVTSDESVKQVSLELCSVRYDNCVQCMRDPYCGWDRETGRCSPYRLGLLQDPVGSVSGLCDASTPNHKLVANLGQSVHLACPIRLHSNGGSTEVVWYYNDVHGSGRRHRIRTRAEKHVLTQDSGLVIIGVNEKDVGRYDCRFGEDTVSTYHLRVDSHTCIAPNKTADYQKIYSDWCHQFQKYKSALKTWEKRQSQCGTPSAEAIKEKLFESNPFL